MRKFVLFSLPIFSMLAASSTIFADAGEDFSPDNKSIQEQQAPAKAPETPFKSFTGKITKNKVRLRQQPSLDSPILKELNQGELLIVIGETDDFYAVKPPADVKAFVYRTYILDNVVEGSRVNLRMEPDIDSPIIGQLPGGTRVEGVVSPLNSKWLEIAPPESVHFYIAKDYVEKIGDPTYMAMLEKRRDEVNQLLSSGYLSSQTEMQKSFPEINLDHAYASFNKVIQSYQDFPEQVARAKELITTTQDNYLQKKIAFLEAKSKLAQQDWQSKNANLNDQMKNQQQRLAALEQQLQKERSSAKAAQAYAETVKQSNAAKVAQDQAASIKMAAWLPNEQAIYQSWANGNNNRSQAEFYQEQQQQAVTLSGILEPYTKSIKNKPGDYVLLNPVNHMPIAYLYSTQVNLQERIGQQVVLYGAKRPNNHFAFPAYFVLSIE